MFTTFRNAWKITDLRKKILFTLLIIVIYRLGVNMPVPFLDASVMQSLVSNNDGSIFSYIDYMTGGAFSQASLFALGVQPYINASIIMQLLAVAIPYLENLRKEGPEGQRKFNRITRYAGGVLSLVLGAMYYWVVRRSGGLKYGAGTELFPQIFTGAVIILAFTAGSMLVMWLGEQIDSKGIGNGISIIIFAGIVARAADLGGSFRAYLAQAASGQSAIYIYLPIIVLLALAAVVMVIVLNNAERRIPVQYAKKVVGRKMYGGQSSHIPIKVNMSGVMPIIFASSLATIPNTVLSFVNLKSEFWIKFWSAFNTQGWVYAVIYGLLIVAFNYFYVAITYNPLEMANNLKKSNGAIPGIRPGKPTSDFISRVIAKITLIGAIFLVVVAVGPIILANITGLSIQLGGTSLLIVVGVALDTSRSLESFMLMRHHKGFLE